MISGLLQPAELRSQYDQAFEDFAHLLATRAEEPRFARLRDLVTFRQQVTWGETGPDRGVRAVQEGVNQGAWFVALSPDDPTARTQQGIFATDWISPTIAATSIRPDPITREWAALGLVMSLEHLQGAVSGREPKFRTDWQHRAEDVRSYEMELLAADVLTQDRFGLAIDAALRANGLKDGKGVVVFGRTEKVWPVLNELKPLVTATDSMSRGEEAMRGGLCLMALGFRAVARTAANSCPVWFVERRRRC